MNRWSVAGIAVMSFVAGAAGMGWALAWALANPDRGKVGI